MFSVGITSDVDEDELKNLASQPKQLNTNYWLIEDYSTLDQYTSALAQGLCSYEPVVTQPPVVAGE